MQISHESLVDSIIREIERIFGHNGFDGTSEQYGWLMAHYNISEEEDVRWQMILEYDMDELVADSDTYLMKFLENKHAVDIFLLNLLMKYRSDILSFTS